MFSTVFTQLHTLRIKQYCYGFSMQVKINIINLICLISFEFSTRSYFISTEFPIKQPLNIEELILKNKSDKIEVQMFLNIENVLKI